MKIVKARIIEVLAMVIAALAWSAAAPAGEPGWPNTLTIATASPGGTYHVYGEGLARLLSRTLDMPVVELTTEGPSQNIEMIEAGTVQLAFVTMGIAQQAWNGTGEWTHGKQYRSIRALFPMYATPFQFVVMKSSAIQSLADLAGKRVGAGPHGGTGGTYVPSFLSALGIDATVTYGTYDELAAQLQDGTIDVLAAAAGAPFPAVAALDAKKEIRFVPVSKDQILALRLAIPELTALAIAPGTYPSLLKSYQTVGLYNFAIANRTCRSISSTASSTPSSPITTR